MGMAGRLGQMWGQANGQYLTHQQQASDVSGGLGAFSKVMRMTLQSGVLGIGAYLVIHNEATGGIMIASSILVSQALAPVELAIANWKGFVGARQGWARLRTSLEDDGSEVRPLQLPAPQASLMVEGAGCGAPQSQRFAVQDVSLELKAGMGLGIIGPSASGKSSLARMLVGVWPTWRGKSPPRRRGPRPVVARGTRTAHRLPAAGRRAVRRDGCPEHRPLPCRQGRGCGAGGDGCRRP